MKVPARSPITERGPVRQAPWVNEWVACMRRLSGAPYERQVNAPFSIDSIARAKNPRIGLAGPPIAEGMMTPNATTSMCRELLLVALASLALGSATGHAADTSPARQLERFGQSGAPGQAERGRVFFTSRHGGEWSCASCHGNPPVAAGRHAGTGKTIAALAPAFNPGSFTDTAKVDKWFRRNCNDVLKRECTTGEKADLLAYLLSLK